MSDQAMQLETIYARALEAVAMGVPRPSTFAYLLTNYPVSTPDLVAQLDAAYRDALRQGVLPEDVDPSWAARAVERGEPGEAEEPLGLDPRLPRA
jgi:hypothetical protein